MSTVPEENTKSQKDPTENPLVDIPSLAVSDEGSSPKTWRQSFREWAYHILSSVAIVALIKWLAFDIYVIPTPSMEGTLLVGDFLLVSKLSYGARTPRTPLQMPLTNGSIWGTDLPSYLDWIQLPSYRLPGIGKVERGEMVVFHYPAETEKPADVRTFYVKRCMAVPGDSLQLRAAALYIDNKLAEELPNKQQRYFLRTARRINARVFERMGIWELTPTTQGYAFHTTATKAAQLAQKPFVMELKPLIVPEDYNDMHVFPPSSYMNWNVDHFGTLQVPYKGMQITLSDTLLALYGSTIIDHEELKNVKIEEGKLYIQEQPRDTYTFAKNYYFMMGDNRHNSQDSRYWGFVPEDHVVGKPKICLMSFDKRSPFWKSFRWSRFFKLLK